MADVVIDGLTCRYGDAPDGRFTVELPGGQCLMALSGKRFAADTALRIESDLMFNSGEVWVEIPEASCVLFPAEGSDLS